MTVSELESTVRGLTDELVETKERLRELENQLDVNAVDVPEREPAPESVPEDDDQDAELPDETTNEADKSPEGDGDSNSTEE